MKTLLQEQKEKEKNKFFFPASDGTRSTEQAIAIGLSKVRRAGVNLPPPLLGRTSLSDRGEALRELIGKARVAAPE